MTEDDIDFLCAAALSALVGPMGTEAVMEDMRDNKNQPAVIARSCFQVALAMLEARKMIVEGEKL